MSIRTWKFLLPRCPQRGTMSAVSFRAKIAQSVYDFLDVGRSPRPADCIFVLAGKQERKIYGIKMWQFGYAPQLILSDSNGFTQMDCQGEHSIPIKKGLFATRTEARQLTKYLSDRSVRSLLVVSAPAHLRRVTLVFRRAFRKSRIELTFVAMPEKPDFTSPLTRSETWTEFLKYILYRFIC